jgi:hypothetical protein
MTHGLKVLLESDSVTILRGARTLGILALGAIIVGIWWVRRNA